MKAGTNAEYGRSRRIGESAEKNYGAEADHQDQPVSERVHCHRDLLSYFVGVVPLPSYIVSASQDA
jgi:hypothetical protein